MSATPRTITRNGLSSTEEPIITSSTPLPKEEYMMPPGMAVIPPLEEPKKEDEALKWDYSKLLAEGTLGDLVANLHHTIAIGTDDDSWELTDGTNGTQDEKGQFDKTLGMILEPLLKKVEYLPLVLGILSLALIETNHVGKHLKVRKEKKAKETAKTTTPVTPAPTTLTTVTPVTPPPNTFDMGRTTPVQQQPTPPPIPVSNQAIDFRTGEPIKDGLPPIRRDEVTTDLGLPAPERTLRPPNAI
ncbi:MAG: hypothetical protein WA549_06010 [Thermoplasmata archaeon]